MKPRFLFPIIIFILFLFSACTSTKNLIIKIENKKNILVPQEKTFLAGVAKIDITPPPGLPLAGHSFMGSIGTGVRMKLMARVLYLQSDKGVAVALVQCDLLSGSRILHHRVAELIADKTNIQAGALMIAGTHGHSSPGNFFDNDFYNQFTGKKGGFNKPYFEFLSEKISEAVISAYNSRRKAKISEGEINIHKATRNRSLAAYHKNKNLEGEKPDVFDSVNPVMHMIRVDCLDDDGIYKPISAFTNFSIHPNLENHDLNDLYNSDNFGFIEREVEWGIKRQFKTAWDPIHVVTNFTHADNTPHYRDDIKLGFKECKRVGTLIGKKALELFITLGKKMNSDPLIQYRAKEIDVFVENNFNGEHLCDPPAVGMALAAGATDRPAAVLGCFPGFAPGWPKKNCLDNCQKEKNLLFGALQPSIMNKKNFPHILFLQAIQVGNTIYLPLPFEITYESGRRIQNITGKIVIDAGFKKKNKYVVINTANEYWGYVTTPEEYSLQYYEGGHTLYGPGTLGFISAHMGQLVIDLYKTPGKNEFPNIWTFTLKQKDYFPKSIKPSGIRKIFKNPWIIIARQKKKGEETYCAFQWFDVPNNMIELDKPLIRVEISSNGADWQPLIMDNIPVDDNGYDIAIINKGKPDKNNMVVYEARWYYPILDGSSQYRFLVLPRGEQNNFYSPPFNSSLISGGK